MVGWVEVGEMLCEMSVFAVICRFVVTSLMERDGFDLRELRKLGWRVRRIDAGVLEEEKLFSTSRAYLLLLRCSRTSYFHNV